MTNEERIEWIKNATYKEVLRKWRFQPYISPWFVDEVGDFYLEEMSKRRKEMPHSEKVKVSKEVGW